MTPPGPPSDVVRLEWLDSTIAVIILEDRTTRNRFSDELVDGVQAAFAAIAARDSARAVVVHGYDQYFCCGGTEEELFRLVDGKAEFTVFSFYDLLMRCELPVVAAMQGHAIGGGLVFGAYADLVVLAEECLYTANFMDYGFTPGLGATFIIPTRFGHTLGWEMLFTARNYHGGELRDRGCPVLVRPRAEVIRTALTLARELADKPAVALRELKKSQVASLRPRLQEAVERELQMHRITFANPEVRQRIESRYGH